MGVGPSPGQVLTHQPLLHREFRHKANITFNDNDTVSFLEYRSFQFQPDKSRGLESDYIVMPNILVLVSLPRGPLTPPSVPGPPCAGLSLAGPGCLPSELPGHVHQPLVWGCLSTSLSLPFQCTNLKFPRGGINEGLNGAPPGHAVVCVIWGEGVSRAPLLCPCEV